MPISSPRYWSARHAWLLGAMLGVAEPLPLQAADLAPSPFSSASVGALVRQAILAASTQEDPRFPLGYQEVQQRRAQLIESLRTLPASRQSEALVWLKAALRSPKAEARAGAAIIAAGLRGAAQPLEAELWDALKTADLDVQKKAAQAVIAISGAKRATRFDEVLAPQLTRQLISSDLKARVRGLVTISLLGDAAASMGTKVLPLLKDPEPLVRAAAAQTLGSLEAQYSVAAPALQGLLKDSEPWVRGAAVLSLGKMRDFARPAVPAMVEILRAKYSDADLRDAAKSALGDLRVSAAAALPALQEMLKDPDATMRSLAAETLARMGDSAQPALPSLVKALADKDADTQRNVLWALSTLGPPAQAGLASLRELAKSGDPQVRKSAVTALARFPWMVTAGGAESSLPQLLDAALDRDPEVQAAAAQSFEDLGVAARGAVAKLAQWLTHERAEVRRLAVRALGRMGESATSSVRAGVLAIAQKDADEDTRLAAIQSVGMLRGASSSAKDLEASTQFLLELIRERSSQSRLRQAALMAFQFYPSAEILETARAILADAAPEATMNSTPAVREAAVGAIAALGMKGVGASKELVAALRDPDVTVSRRVVSAMGQLGAFFPAPAIREIGKLAGDLSAPESSRLAAIKALCRLEKYASAEVPVLAAILERKSDSDRLRDHAAFALRVVGLSGSVVSTTVRMHAEARVKAKREYFQNIDF